MSNLKEGLKKHPRKVAVVATSTGAGLITLTSLIRPNIVSPEVGVITGAIGVIVWAGGTRTILGEEPLPSKDQSSSKRLTTSEKNPNTER